MIEIFCVFPMTFEGVVVQKDNCLCLNLNIIINFVFRESHGQTLLGQVQVHLFKVKLKYSLVCNHMNFSLRSNDLLHLVFKSFFLHSLWPHCINPILIILILTDQHDHIVTTKCKINEFERIMEDMSWNKDLGIRIDLYGHLTLVLWLSNQCILTISIHIDGHSNDLIGGNSTGENLAVLKEVVLNRRKNT